MILKEILSYFKGAIPDENALEEQFLKIAQQLICGGFIEVRSGERMKRIFVDDVEFYYHEEKENGLLDPIMYHRSHLEYAKPKTEDYYFATGELNLHQSGIDITFENKELQFRASALIRAFRVEKEGKTDPYSTHLYDELFKGMSVLDGISIKWIDMDSEDREVNPKSFTRKNVRKYQGYKKTSEKCDRRWRYKLLDKKS